MRCRRSWRSGTVSFLPGSVSEAIVRSSQCDVLVVPLPE
ncbi:hypothetical protein B0X71_17115 [Planococcus lenghuensis]|uniref:UspA domain-containing protein n=1 Tax=Planococcus lenghuensis TaxID=2213202 RepID=A0A1Q2L460_9BACL|nr:hypothetical protein B0X71_17115 [Planococcus lenghuensis]